MNDNQETINAIIQEMNYGKIPKHKLDIELLRHYADRIEVAYKREKVLMDEMRKALDRLVKTISRYDFENPLWSGFNGKGTTSLNNAISVLCTT